MTNPGPISDCLHVCLFEKIKRRENKPFDVTVPSGHVERVRLRLAAQSPMARPQEAAGALIISPGLGIAGLFGMVKPASLPAFSGNGAAA